MTITTEAAEEELLTLQILRLYHAYPGISQKLIADATGATTTHVSVALRTVRELEMMKAQGIDPTRI